MVGGRFLGIFKALRESLLDCECALFESLISGIGGGEDPEDSGYSLVMACLSRELTYGRCARFPRITGDER